MDLSTLNWLDYVILGIIGFSVIISLIRGFIREAFSLVTWGAAFWISFTFIHEMAALLEPYISVLRVRTVLAFFVLFVSILLLGAFINFLFSQLVKKSGLSGTDRMLGIVFGLGRGTLVVALLLLLADFMHMTEDPGWRASTFAPHFQPVTAWLGDFLPDELTKRNEKKMVNLINPGAEEGSSDLLTIQEVNDAI